MKKVLLFALSALCAAAPSVAHAQLLPGCPRPNPATPFAFVVVNGQCTDLSAAITRAPGAKVFNLNTQVNLAGSTINVQALLNPDPFVKFGVTTVNVLPGTMTYSFLFGTPVVPGFYTSALGQANVGVTSTAGTTTVANSQTFPSFVSGYGSLGDVLTNLGVNLGNSPCTVSGVVQSANCDLGQSASTFNAAFYDNLETLVTYTQENVASSASFSGQVTLAGQTNGTTTTPEPATLALLGTGLLVLGGWRSRRRSRV